ncbi:Aste57867_15281 [Aphanomyces stellatus]|uniref:Aste57867_15281 protein n=1 Tax=Aphanomyces stellatus TaxID=120398 RepID=A0A485L318_9STRA|nr:hypothetical protein As57867_015225 [Aphanomyces stellatus]VFT92090.1 Aste57867_15281 [Aphanomyces stellatus]
MHDAHGCVPIVCGSLMFYLLWLSAASASSMSIQGAGETCPRDTIFETVVAAKGGRVSTIAIATEDNNLDGLKDGQVTWWQERVGTRTPTSSQAAVVQCPNNASTGGVAMTKPKKKKKGKNADKHIALKLLLFGIVVMVVTTLF